MQEGLQYPGSHHTRPGMNSRQADSVAPVCISAEGPFIVLSSLTLRKQGLGTALTSS